MTRPAAARFCAAMAVACALTAAMPAAAATLTGTVVLQGAPPEPRKLPVTIDQYVCGKEKDAEDLLVSPQRSIRNAVVWIENPPARPAADRPAVVAMDQKECVFIPRVIVVPAGGRVDFLNSDRLLHNIHGAPKVNPPFNRTQPRGRTIPITFAHPEIIQVSCDLHSWMRAWVVVADHPFYAVTDGNGRFAFPGLPAGRYTLRVWHERLGTTSRDVVVGDQDATAVTVEMGAR
jgi:plastocyanin